MRQFVTLKLIILRLEAEEKYWTPASTSHQMTSGKTDTSDRRSSDALQQHLLQKLDSLILQEKNRAQKRRRTRRSVPYRTTGRKTKTVRVPRDPDCPEGEWTEGELRSSSDSDIY
nr:hypothetical protein [Torque teno virus]